MTKTKKGVIVVLAVIGIAAAAYFLMPKTKAQKIQFLIAGNFTTGSAAQLNTLGDAYINAWYLAAKANQLTFTLAGVTYDSQGGRAVTPGN